MKCYSYEEGNQFILCVENVPTAYAENIGGFERKGDKYYRIFPNSIDEKNIIASNFPKLGPSYFKNEGDWQQSLLTFAEKCEANSIRWYVFGSTSEAVAGVSIKPSDIDIVTHSDDFYKVRDIFANNMIEPFFDNKGEWFLRYFGRLCINGFKVEVAADEAWNEVQRVYSPVVWRGYHLKVEPLQTRYNTELQRNRSDRIMMFEEFFNNANNA